MKTLGRGEGRRNSHPKTMAENNMNKRAVAFIALFAVSVAMMIYKAESEYQNLAAVAKWSRAFGYAAFPWLVGLLVGGLKEVWARLGKKTYSFSRSVLWGTGVSVSLIVVVAIFNFARTADKQRVRDDALLLMGASVAVPAIAAYCNKHVAPNEELVSAAKAWNERHHDQLSKIVQAIEWAGGLTKEEKDLIDRMGFLVLKNEMEAKDDKPGYCESTAHTLDQGNWDLSKREDTAQALQRIMRLELK